MTRTVRTFLPVVGEADALISAFVGDPQRWLPAARRDGPGRYAFLVPAKSVARTVVATIGDPWRIGDTHWRSISWEPVTEDGSPGAIDRLLPSLDGELGLHISSRGRATLILDARYLPPGGAVGLAADALALGRVARDTIEHVLGDVAARLGAEAMLSDRPARPPAQPVSV